MMTRLLLILAVVLACVVAGCQQASGPGVQVQVRAEPKQGYTPPGPEDTGYLPAGDPALQQSHDHAYHLIDYRRLDGVVVCLEPQDLQPVKQEPPAEVAIDVNAAVKPTGQVFAMQGGGRLNFRNGGRGDQAVLVRWPSGEIMEVLVPQGGGVTSEIGTRGPAGPVEVLRDQDDEPMAYVYLHPSPVRLVRGGERVTFAPLSPGKYRVSTWHPLLPGSSEVVEVAPGKLAKVTLTVGVNSLPKPSR